MRRFQQHDDNSDFTTLTVAMAAAADELIRLIVILRQKMGRNIAKVWQMPDRPTFRQYIGQHYRTHPTRSYQLQIGIYRNYEHCWTQHYIHLSLAWVLIFIAVYGLNISCHIVWNWNGCAWMCVFLQCFSAADLFIWLIADKASGSISSKMRRMDQWTKAQMCVLCVVYSWVAVRVYICCFLVHLCSLPSRSRSCSFVRPSDIIIWAQWLTVWKKKN